MQMAEEPDMRELLQRALGTVMGTAPPVRFKLSGVASPGARPGAGSRGRRRRIARRGHRPMTSRRPTTMPSEYYETISAPHPWVADAEPEPTAEKPARASADAPASPAAEGAPAGGISRQLMESLGAEIVEHRPAEAAGGGDEAPLGDTEADLADLETSDFGLKDPELFDSDDWRGLIVNFGNMMKQAQKMQAKMAEMQEQLKTERLEASAGGGMVRVVDHRRPAGRSSFTSTRLPSTPTTSRCFRTWSRRRSTRRSARRRSSQAVAWARSPAA